MDDISYNGHAPEPDPEEHANGLQAFATLGQFLEEDEWYPQRADGWHGYWVNYNGTNADLRCFAQIRVEAEQLVIYASAPVKVPEALFPASAEFITRANYGLTIGNFELNYENGSVRYKSSLDFEGESLTPNLIRNAIYPAVRTMNHYLPGLMKVLYGNVSPQDAIKEIED